MNIRSIYSIFRKDFLDALRTARLLVIILLPVGFSVIYGYLFKEARPSEKIIVYGDVSAPLSERLMGLEGVSIMLVDSASELEEAIRMEEAQLGVVFPSNFLRDLQAGEQPKVEFIFQEDPEKARALEGMVLGEIENLSGRLPTVEAIERPLFTELEVESKVSEPLDLFQELGVQEYLIILWVMMGVTMNGVFLVPSILVEEKDKHTLDAILVTPTRQVDVILAKLLVGMFYLTLSTLTILILNDGFTGNMFTLSLTILMAGLATTLIGLLIGGLLDNMNALNTWGSFIMLPLMFPGIIAGIPLGDLGVFLRVPMQILPTFHLIRGMALCMLGRGREVYLHWGVLAIEVIVLFGAVYWSLKQRQK